MTVIQIIRFRARFDSQGVPITVRKVVATKADAVSLVGTTLSWTGRECPHGYASEDEDISYCEAIYVDGVKIYPLEEV